MKVAFKFNPGLELTKQMQNLSARTGQSLRDMLKEQTGELALELIRRTPPKTLKQGQGAVMNDLRKIFMPWNASFLEQLIKDHGMRKFENFSIFTKSGRKFIADDITLSPDGTGMVDFHKANRGARGRVYTAGTGGDKVIGRNRSRHQMYIGYEAWQAYVKKILKRIGYLKSGWYAAFWKFKVGDKSSVPNWVSQHEDGINGGYDDSKINSTFPEITIINKCKGISDSRFANIVNSAMKTRAMAISNKIKYIINGHINKRFK